MNYHKFIESIANCLMVEEYLIVKRDHSILYDKFSGTDTERKLREQKKKEHLYVSFEHCY
jgi:hypothetical protein